MSKTKRILAVVMTILGTVAIIADALITAALRVVVPVSVIGWVFTEVLYSDTPANAVAATVAPVAVAFLLVYLLVAAVTGVTVAAASEMMSSRAGKRRRAEALRRRATPFA